MVLGGLFHFAEQYISGIVLSQFKPGRNPVGDLLKYLLFLTWWLQDARQLRRCVIILCRRVRRLQQTATGRVLFWSRASVSLLLSIKIVLLVDRLPGSQSFWQIEFRAMSNDLKKSLSPSRSRAILRSAGGMPSIPVAVL